MGTSNRALDWNCTSQGCFQYVMAPRLKFFDQYLGGKCSPSDIDGVIERNGHILLIEWKSGHTEIPLGQHILFENFAFKRGIPVLVLWGDAQAMTTHKQRHYSTGGAITDQKYDMDYVGLWLQKQYRYWDKHPWESK